MRAMVLRAIGGPEVLALEEVPMPTAGPGQVLVRVQAAAVNPIDYKLRRTGALGVKPGAILGFDAAGIVEAIGPGVRYVRPGDEVYYSPDFTLPGAYAEYNVVREEIVCKKPRGLSMVEAASIPLAGMTAWDGIITRGALRLGDTVLISAANGGVGSIALQLAKAAGAFVLATCSTRNMEFVRSLGPDRAIDYQKEDFAQVVQRETAGLDLVYDCAGQDYVAKSMALMKPLGRIVTIVNPSGPLEVGYRKNVVLHYEFLQRRRETLEYLATILERKQLRPIIDSVMTLEHAAEAHRRLEAGGVKGKIVLTP